MPVSYKCRICGKTIYAYAASGREQFLSPLEVAESHDLKCPFCGSRITGRLNPNWRRHIRVRVTGHEV